MSIFIVGIAAVLTAFIWVLKRDICYPAFVCNLIWTLSVLMCILPGSGYYSPGTLSTVIMLLFLMIFPFGCFFGEKYIITIGKRNNYRIYKKYSLRSKLFIILCFFAIAVLIAQDLIIIRNLITGLSFHDLARLGITTEAHSGIMAYVMIFVVYPVVTIASPVCSVEYFSGGRNKNVFFLINVALVALSALDHGGRVQLFFMAVCYIFGACLYGKEFKLTQKQKIWVYLILISLGVLIIILSISRGIDDLWESVRLYLGGSIPHMEARLQQSDFSAEHTLGTLSLRGFIVPLMLILQFIGLASGNGHKYLLAEKLSVLIEQDTVIGSNGVRTNAFLPAPYYFYIDWGLIGVAIGTFVYAFILGRIYKNAKQMPSKKSYALYLLMIYGLIFSFIRFPFKTYQYAVGFVFLMFIYRKEEMENE